MSKKSIPKQFKEKGKAVFDGPKVKQRKKFAPVTKVEKSKKEYKRKKETFDESVDISMFLDNLISKNYAEADKYIKRVIDSKIQERIARELNTPLFDK